jgi:hypothetical protein
MRGSAQYCTVPYNTAHSTAKNLYLTSWVLLFKRLSNFKRLKEFICLAGAPINVSSLVAASHRVSWTAVPSVCLIGSALGTKRWHHYFSWELNRGRDREGIHRQIECENRVNAEAHSFILLSSCSGPTPALIKKEKKIFLINWEIQTGAVAKSYVTNASLFMIKYCAFPHILGSPSSYVRNRSHLNFLKYDKYEEFFLSLPSVLSAITISVTLYRFFSVLLFLPSVSCW